MRNNKDILDHYLELFGLCNDYFQNLMSKFESISYFLLKIGKQLNFNALICILFHTFKHIHVEHCQQSSPQEKPQSYFRLSPL